MNFVMVLHINMDIINFLHCFSVSSYCFLQKEISSIHSHIKHLEREQTTTTNTLTHILKESSLNLMSSPGETKSEGNDEAAAPFQIQSIEGVCFWKWGDIGSENCAICKFKITEPSVEYLANPTPTFNAGLKVVFGACGHCFHLDCLEKWRRTRGTCPLCQKEWDPLKVEVIPGYENQLNNT